MLGAKHRAFGKHQVFAGEHRKHAIADQFQDVAAGVMDGVDGGLRIIIEERDDLVGRNAFGDRPSSRADRKTTRPH